MHYLSNDLRSGRALHARLELAHQTFVSPNVLGYLTEGCGKQPSTSEKARERHIIPERRRMPKAHRLEEGGGLMEYGLIRTARKTVAIYVRDGVVEVRAPMGTPKPEIDSFVASKDQWIRAKLALSAERQAQRDGFALTYGGFVTYRGRPYPITAREGGHMGFDGECFYVPPGLASGQLKHAWVGVLRSLAKHDLLGRVQAFARQMAVEPIGVRVTGAKARWGSCSAKRSLCFSWRLMMAEDDVIDYVVVHELAHITEMNHSSRFWAIVRDVLPDYHGRKARLRRFQDKLMLENWD
jgi:predicted metal-dependent hydrolase